MIVKNTSVFTGEEVIEETCKYGKKQYYKKFIFPSILLIFGVIVIIIVSLQGNTTNTLTLGSLFLAFSIVLYGLNFYSLLSFKRRTIKKNPEVVELGMKNEFVFKEESLSLHTIVGKTTSKVEYPYVNLKIVEYDDQILFKVSDGEYYICKKEGFVSNKELDLFFYGLQKHKIKIKNKLSKPKEKK